MKTTFVILSFFLFCGCTTKILKPELINDVSEKPQLIDYHDRWFLGFVRSSYTDPKTACVSDIPVKTYDFFSLEDFLLSLITIGVYTPATTYVWCAPQPPENVSK